MEITDMKLVKVGNDYVNPDKIISIEYVSLADINKRKIEVHLIDGLVVQEPVKTKQDIDNIISRLTGTDVVECAKKIRDCCQTYRDNAETDYCQGCPFWYKGVYFTGCLLKDSTYNEVDNPGDWELDD